jgi:hypothetical protein
MRAPLRWLDLDAASSTGHPTAISDIFARRLDGMTVTGLFTEQECASAIEQLRSTEAEQLPTMFGTVLGQPVAMRPSPDPGPTDPFDRVAAAVAPMAEGRSIGPPVEDGRAYLGGNIRWYQPGRGGLPSHVGNEFPMHHDPSLWYLRQQADTLDHVSYFVVLQPPEVGGELSVFDLLYEEEAPELEQWGNEGRKDGPMDDVPATRISPPAGSMILFGGGWRWHRVEPIEGNRPRITYGGFACRAHDDRSLYFWI